MTAPNSQKPKLLIIDGNSLVHRAYHALPALQTKDGKLVNAVYGFAAILFKALKELKPTHLAVAFDKGVPTFRHEAYEAYKAKRPKQPQELYDQLPIIKDLLRALGVPAFEISGFEADDIIATISSASESEGAETVILTGDLDALQLVSDKTKVLTPHKGMSETVIYDRTMVKKRFGLEPEQMIDYKSLRGDPSDNIPGVPGVGEKTATDLLKRFGSLAALYRAVEEESEAVEDIKTGIREKLVEHKKDALFARDLVRLRHDVPLKFDLDTCKLSFPEEKKERLRKIFQTFGFRTLLTRLDEIFSGAGSVAEERGKQEEESKKSKSEKLDSVELVEPTASETEIAAILEKLRRHGEAAVYILRQGDVFSGTILGVAFAARGEKPVFIKLNFRLGGKNKLPKPLADFLRGERVKKYGHNLKEAVSVFAGASVELGGTLFDIMLASYLLHPGSRAHDLETLIFEIGGSEVSEKSPMENEIGQTLFRAE